MRSHHNLVLPGQYIPGKDARYVFFNSVVSNDTSLTLRNQPVNYTFSCVYRATYLVNNAVFSQRSVNTPRPDPRGKKVVRGLKMSSFFSRVATVYVSNGTLGSFKSQLSMGVFTVSLRERGRSL